MFAKENVAQFHDGRPEDVLKHTMNKAKNYLDDCSLQELAHLEAVHIFLKDVASWVVAAANCEDLLIYSPHSGA